MVARMLSSVMANHERSDPKEHIKTQKPREKNDRGFSADIVDVKLS